jgi:hypothetical protein
MIQTGGNSEIDFEADIAMRMDRLVARKRADNELAIARIATLDTVWKDVNRDIDRDLKTGLDGARLEVQALKDAKERLTRHVCDGIDERAYGLSGKVVDVTSKVGLPGLTVKVALATDPAGQSMEAKTDNYGDFFFSFALDAAVVSRMKQIPLLIVVLFDTDTVVHRGQRSFEPKAGAIEHLTISVDCTGRLKEVLEHGRQVVASVEGDAKLVEDRATNLGAAYATLQRLSETTLSELGRLKEELSAAPSRPASSGPTSAGPVTTASAPARFLGNSHTRELHDLENAKKQCRIDEIKPDYRVPFRTEREAVAAGYDFCQFCFGKQKSKR